jgi:hypothetical protein
VGLKMLVSHWVEVPIVLTLAIVILTLAVSVVASILNPQPRIGPPPAR